MTVNRALPHLRKPRSWSQTVAWRRLVHPCWCIGLMTVALSGPGLAIDLGAIGKARDALSATQEAVSSGKEILSSAGEIVHGARQRLKPGGVAVKTPGAAAAAAHEGGGTGRLIVVLGEASSASARAGRTVVSLRDQGPYLAQRQSAFVAPAQAQWLAVPRGDSSAVSIDLAADPAGTLLDFSTGRVRSAGRGVKIFTLSEHANLPRRGERRALDAIEQHGMLQASSLHLEWPRQAADILEPIGGQLLVWASEDGVLFPTAFGADGKLFTEDDPKAKLSRGYTVVTLERRGFGFDRSREVALSLHPVRAAPDIDLSRLGHAEAFQAFIRLMSERYPYTNVRPVDWTQLQSEMLERVQAAAQARDAPAYAQVFRDIGERLHDAQFRVYLPDGGLLLPGAAWADLGLSSQPRPRGGVSIPMPRVWLLEDGRAMVSDVADPSAAARAGLLAGAEIIEVAGEPLRRYLERGAARSPWATDGPRLLDSLALGTAVGDSVSIKVKQEGVERTLQLRRERQASAVQAAATADAAPAGFQLRSVSGKSYAYIALASFSEAETSLELWERSLASAKQAGLPGLILDLRGHRGDSLELVAHLLASFFSEQQPLRNPGDTQRQFDPVTGVWRTRGGLGLPLHLPLYSAGDRHYAGKLILLTGRQCGGACQLFSTWLQRAGRAQVLATAPSAGGAVGHGMRVSLPGGVAVSVPVVAEIGQAGESYADGQGGRPDFRIPVDHDFVQSVMKGGDPVLDAAVLRLDQLQRQR